jgi:hypothetical protein
MRQRVAPGQCNCIKHSGYSGVQCQSNADDVHSKRCFEFRSPAFLGLGNDKPRVLVTEGSIRTIEVSAMDSGR